MVEVLDLGLQPLANDFKDEWQERAGFAPLKVMYCPECTLAQLNVVVNPNVLYSNYAYETSRSETMRQHFELLWESLRAFCPMQNIIEIGSNDGLFLEFCMSKGAKRVCGIDPASNLAVRANARGIPTIDSEFCNEAAIEAGGQCSPVDLIVGRHVFCHVDDWRAFVQALEVLASSETIILIEAPYCMDLLNNGQFDTIYHEHLSYLTLKSIQHVLVGTGLEIADVFQYGVHGGALGIMLRTRSGQQPGKTFLHLVDKENVTVDSWRAFEVVAKQQIADMRETVSKLKAAGKRVAGFGASAKSTVWLNACGFSRKEIDFIADCTKHKWYRFSPGTDIPVYEEAALIREQPEYAIMFCWNYKDEVMKRNEEWVARGGKFIVPVPKIAFLDKNCS